MNELISIIVPIYKVEDYLNVCLDGIMYQSYSKFEVLLINDGSPDDSEKICLDFVNRDKRFKYYYKDNGGVSSARNLGLELAKGKYIVFIDPDDIIEDNLLLDFIKNIMLDDSILVMQDFKRKSGTEILNKFQNYKDTLFIFPNDINKFIENYKYTQGYLWNKIFKRSIIVENNIRFDEDLTLCEDEVFYHIYIRFCNGIKIITNDNYIYNEREGSLTKSYPSFESQLKYLKYSYEFLKYLNKNLTKREALEYTSKVNFRNFNYTLYSIILDRTSTNYYKISCLKTFRINKNIDFDLIKPISNIRKIDFFLFKYKFFGLLVYSKKIRSKF